MKILPSVDLRICAKTDGPAFPELASQAVHGELDRAVILEAGTAGGKTSIALFISLPDGRVAIGEVTAAMFLTLAGGLKGAMSRFGDDPSGYA